MINSKIPDKLHLVLSEFDLAKAPGKAATWGKAETDHTSV